MILMIITAQYNCHKLPQANLVKLRNQLHKRTVVVFVGPYCVPYVTGLATVHTAAVRQARLSADFYRATRIYSANYAVATCLSVCPSVRHTPVFCQNG